MTHRIPSGHQKVYDLWERRGGFVCIIKTDFHFTAWEIVTSAEQENGNYETRHFTIGGARRQQKFGNLRWESFIDAKLMCPYAYTRIRSQPWSHQFIVIVKARVWVTQSGVAMYIIPMKYHAAPGAAIFRFLGGSLSSDTGLGAPSSVHYINWIWIIEVFIIITFSQRHGSHKRLGLQTCSPEVQTHIHIL